MRRIKHNLGRLPQVRMGHHRMPDAVLGLGLAGAIAVGTLLPVSQAFASPSSHRADAAAVTTADAAAAQDANRDGGQSASRSETREPVQQQSPAPADQAAADQAAADQAAAEKAAADQAAAEKAAADQAAAQQAAEQAAAPAKKTYANNLDGWIEEARDVLAANGKHVPSAKAMRAAAIAESSGNPTAQNNWDSNAKKGTPSIGLTQMIQPTFKAYALPGHNDIRNPVDNLVASSQYCDARYGNMDNMAAARGYGSHWRGY
ncbi:transglycosylase SLT domain-containing protein [Kitasatospora cineracea]|uniref:transglycosylase SLT domain-containing protein n=1 Tax=Kitasatospora cineracea TaxID=88074 RepID=UPI00343B3A3B